MHEISLGELGDAIGKYTGTNFKIAHIKQVGGGSINQCYMVTDGKQKYFVKCNEIAKLSNLQAESIGLQQLAAATKLIKIPKPIGCGILEDQAILVLEFFELTTQADANSWYEFGNALALMHLFDIATINADLSTHDDDNLPVTSVTSVKSVKSVSYDFGCKLSNATLGNLPGYVGEHENWAEFFCKYRLGFQLDICTSKGIEFAQADKLLTVVRKLLDHNPTPSLTHGDLWTGNMSFCKQGSKLHPCIFDPASQVADCETDLAMSMLFGALPDQFYKGYSQINPISSDFWQRRPVYDLYHILNHFNLFGGNYLQNARDLISQIVQE